MRRRHLIQAGLALPLVRWASASAQTDRNLVAGERKAGPGVVDTASLLVAPRRALVIGNSDYGFGPLKNPANDAKAIGEELKRTGFEVTTGLDLPRKEMLEVIRAYGEALSRSKSVGVFYFAGHGVQLAWRNYLLPVDALISRVDDIQARCVDVNAVIEGIAKAANPMNVIILDACRENPFHGVKLDQKGLSQLDAPPGTFLAYATAPGNLASDGEGANGLYTEQLLREIKVPEAKIEDVFKRVRLAVRRRSNGAQVPWESTSLEEDFWFIPPAELRKVALEAAERQRLALEAERQREERIARAQRDEAERLKREAQAERARREAELERQRQEAAERVRRQLEEAEREREAALEKAYEAELAVWQRVSGAKEPGPIEDYLRRYPSGNFAELAQLELDQVLRRQGEKKVEAVSAPQNPYTLGTLRADLAFKVGDSYTYAVLDRDTREERRRITGRVTAVTDESVEFGNGALILDRLGNTVKLPDGRRFTPRQDQPLEYAVGKRWRTRFSGKNARGFTFDTEFEFRIVGREKITVPAGTFDCYVIEGDGWSVNDQGGIKQRIGLKRWMAPDKVRRPIALEEFRKIEGRAGAPKRNEYKSGFGRVVENVRQELVSFTQT